MRGQDIIKEQHFEEWKSQIDKSSVESASFLSYFDASSSVEESITQGAWDFAHHILRPAVIPFIGVPFEGEVLELGFGGGRLIAAASRYFKQAHGVDIHNQFDKVRDLLAGMGIENVTLHSGDGSTLPLADNSIDFVYSFIVLQHLPTLAVLESYLSEIKRVLKPGKPAILYLGYLEFNWRLQDYVDMKTRDVDSSRQNTLLLRPALAKKLVRKHGLTLRGAGRSQRKPWSSLLGNQHYVIVTA